MTTQYNITTEDPRIACAWAGTVTSAMGEKYRRVNKARLAFSITSNNPLIAPLIQSGFKGKSGPNVTTVEFVFPKEEDWSALDLFYHEVQVFELRQHGMDISHLPPQPLTIDRLIKAKLLHDYKILTEPGWFSPSIVFPASIAIMPGPIIAYSGDHNAQYAEEMLVGLGAGGTTLDIDKLPGRDAVGAIQDNRKIKALIVDPGHPLTTYCRGYYGGYDEIHRTVNCIVVVDNEDDFDLRFEPLWSNCIVLQKERFSPDTFTRRGESLATKLSVDYNHFELVRRKVEGRG